MGRRIHKRMAEADISSYADYRDLLEINSGEFGVLFNTILINRTSMVQQAAGMLSVHLAGVARDMVEGRLDP
ncbi:hypothetical protein ACIG3E_05585 [Streptomyces sp. NPDC053474]|uniref:hypothetical protein n=1 Tax=Streptomyces sp. NPDC053474 TaxID=3365704 RepID=UPI0037D2ABC5